MPVKENGIAFSYPERLPFGHKQAIFLPRIIIADYSFSRFGFAPIWSHMAAKALLIGALVEHIDDR